MFAGTQGLIGFWRAKEQEATPQIQHVLVCSPTYCTGFVVVGHIPHAILILATRLCSPAVLKPRGPRETRFPQWVWRKWEVIRNTVSLGFPSTFTVYLYESYG